MYRSVPPLDVVMQTAQTTLLLKEEVAMWFKNLHGIENSAILLTLTRLWNVKVMLNIWACLLMRMVYHENLSCKHRIIHSASKIRTSISISARLRHFLPLNTLQYIYRSPIQPYLLYGIVWWGRAKKETLRNKIVRLQKGALRLLFFRDCESHAIPFFISSSLLLLDLL